MSNIEEHIAPELLLAYIKNDISSSNAAIVEAWIQAKPEHALYIEQCKQIWEETGILVPKPIHVNIDDAWHIMNNRIERFEKQQNNTNTIRFTPRIIIRAAAIVLIPLLAFSIYYLLQPRTKSHIIIASEHSLYDTLTDGSTIALAPHAHIEVADFSGAVREVHMQGEVNFSVAKDAGKPFLVKTENTVIKVVGTKFNVISFSNKPEIEVLVESGKVLFFAINQHDTAFVTLEAGDKGVYNKTTKKLTKLKPEEGIDLFWNNKTLLFQKTKLRDIANMLEKHYNVSIEFKTKELEALRFTSTFQNQSIDTILWIMGTTLDFTYTKQDNTYVLQSHE